MRRKNQWTKVFWQLIRHSHFIREPNGRDRINERKKEQLHTERKSNDNGRKVNVKIYKSISKNAKRRLFYKSPPYEWMVYGVECFNTQAACGKPIINISKQWREFIVFIFNIVILCHNRGLGIYIFHLTFVDFSMRVKWIFFFMWQRITTEK